MPRHAPRSPAPPSPLGPGFRSTSASPAPLSPPRIGLPVGNLSTPPKSSRSTPSTLASSQSATRPVLVSALKKADQNNTPVLQHPQPPAHPSVSDATTAATTTSVLRPPSSYHRPISTATTVRTSTASGFDFMEAMLAPYERDEDDDEDLTEFYHQNGRESESEEDEKSDEIVTPVTPAGAGGPRVGKRRDKTPERISEDESRIRSVEASLIGEDDHTDVISFKPVTHAPVSVEMLVEARATKRKTIIEFPDPSLGARMRANRDMSQASQPVRPTRTQPPKDQSPSPIQRSPVSANHPSVPRIIIPSGDPTAPAPASSTPTQPMQNQTNPFSLRRHPGVQVFDDPSRLSLHRPSNSPRSPPKAYTIPNLPSSGVPISPHLAAPPTNLPSTPFSNPPFPGQGFVPPRSPFAGPSPHRGSNSSDSITGYDLLKEKKALFRGGEEEIVSPISPRKPRQESGLRVGVKARNGVPSTMDFWKRFSVSVNKLDEVKHGQKEGSGDR